LDGVAVAMDAVGPAPATVAGPLAIGDPHNGRPFKGDVGDLRICNRKLTPAEAETLAVGEPVRFILGTPEDKRSRDQKQRLLDYFLAHEAPADLRRAYAELNSLNDRLARIEKEIDNV